MAVELLNISGCTRNAKCRNLHKMPSRGKLSMGIWNLRALVTTAVLLLCVTLSNVERRVALLPDCAHFYSLCLEGHSDAYLQR